MNQIRKGDWIAVDLDGTLTFDQYEPGHIGNPVRDMVVQVQNWLRDGVHVDIFTSRADPSSPRSEQNIAQIKAWTLRQFGQELNVTAVKHAYYRYFFDDRAVVVERNTGRILAPEGVVA